VLGLEEGGFSFFFFFFFFFWFLGEGENTICLGVDMYEVCEHSKSWDL